jgi:arylsulfatase A-like enzyme
MIRPTFALIISVAALWTALSCRPSAQAPAGESRLLVIVVIDQLRSDYLARYKAFWREGFARLLDDGAVFERAAYPYLNTVTCAGHATIATGALPSTHGVIMNEWWHRDVGAKMACTVDPKVKSVVYGGQPERVGHSAFRLRIPTLGDRLRAASPQSRVVTLSLKPRSAVMLAGHGGTAVTWFADTSTWATSTAYTSNPVRAVQTYISENPVERYRGEIWNRVYDPSSYSGVDDGVGERPPTGWTAMFAHPLAGDADARRDRFHDLWRRSPYSDAELGEVAAALVKSMKLGQRGVVDYLGVSFSALDYVGHNFGPDSHEVQDTLVRMDRTLGKFLTMLDQTVGKGRYVLALSSDHGVGFIPEALKERGQEAGRVLNEVLTKTAEAAMVKAHGPGPHVAHVEYTEVYFTDKTRRLVASNAKALEPLFAALGRVPGVLRAVSTRDFPKKRSSSDPAERAAALGHFPAMSGDVQILLKPNWVGTDTSAASHGTFHAYDQQVPVIFFGDGIDDGRYRDAATPADIAPTLASTIRLALPGIDGKVLKRALK